MGARTFPSWFALLHLHTYAEGWVRTFSLLMGSAALAVDLSFRHVHDCQSKQM